MEAKRGNCSTDAVDVFRQGLKDNPDMSPAVCAVQTLSKFIRTSEGKHSYYLQTSQPGPTLSLAEESMLLDTRELSSAAKNICPTRRALHVLVFSSCK